MSPAQIEKMHDREIVEMLVSLHPSSEAVALLSVILTNNAAFEGVRELRRRFTTSDEIETPKTLTGRVGSARTVAVDPDRWKSFFWRRRIAMVDVGPMMEPPRCEGWGSVVSSRGRAGLYALDDLACALSIRVEELIEKCGTDAERARLASFV